MTASDGGGTSGAPPSHPNLPEGGLARLQAIVERLRGPDGCPWDKRQDLQTMRQYLLEETYEVLEAIDTGDTIEHADELGDLLFQIVFQAHLQAERGAFDLERVIGGICDKLVRRHPHVFGDEQGMDEAEVAARWETMKRAEGKGTVHDVPSALPALTRAQKIGKRAARMGFDWPDAWGALDKLKEEVAELEAAMRMAAGRPKSTSAEVREELGDVLFSAVNIARHVAVEAEDALRGTTAKFLRRFRAVEGGLAAAGQSLEDATLEQMEAHWVAAKSTDGSLPPTD